MRNGKFLLLGMVCVLVAGTVLAQGTFVIRNAKIVTVSGETLEKASLVIQDGKITEIGARVRVPSRATVIEGAGLSVYPGLFNADTQIGLTEVGQVTVSNDFNELGEFMPHLLAFSAVHVESEHIPVARVDGVTHVLTRPSGGVMPGQGAVMSLDGWNQEEMEINRHGAMILSFPSQIPRRRGFFGGGGARARSYSDTKKEAEQKIAQLKEFLARGRHYMGVREKGIAVEFDRQLEALIPMLKGKQAVLIEADAVPDIRAAVEFAQEEGLNFVILGARDAWKIAEELGEKKVRVILGPTQDLPSRDDDPVDLVYRAAAMLHEKGVQLAFATGGSSDARTLPFEVGNAVAHGLPHDIALRSITLTPAEFLGVADQVGSVEVGKKANLVIAQGDILEYQTSIKHVFINGAPVSLESKHTQLYKKYLNRP